MREPSNTDRAASAPRAPGTRRGPARAALWLCAAAAHFAAAQDAPLTAGFGAVPQRHDGSTPFVVELAFDAPMAGQARVKLASALRIDGANLLAARSLSSGVRDRWRLRLRPTSGAPVTVTLPAGGDCDSAPCSADGRALAEAVSVTVPGP